MFAMFERIEKQGRSGAYKALSEKALQLTGGPSSARPPAGENVYGALVAGGQFRHFHQLLHQCDDRPARTGVAEDGAGARCDQRRESARNR